MIKLAFYVVMGVAIVLNLVNAVLNMPNTHAATSKIQTPTPAETPTVSPTVPPVPTPCFPDDPKKPCPTPTATAEPVPTTSPTMLP